MMSWKSTTITKDYYIPPDISEKEAEEIKLREENASVKDAWEKYQIILKLAMT